MNETPMFDPRHIQRAFSRSANSYDAAAQLQHEVEGWLLESLDYFALDGTRAGAEGAAEARTPRTVLDLGCGTGRAARAMQVRWPKAQVLALDLALPMLRTHPQPQGLVSGMLARLRTRSPMRVCADARALPLAEHSVDLVFSNLCVQWIDDLPALFAGLRRVLRPGGLLLVSSFGPDTLHELRSAFAEADAAPHVSPFAPMAQFGDALVAAGFRDPVLDRDILRTHYPDLAALMRELRAIGATNALTSRRRSLTGRARFAAAERAYAAWRETDGRLPATWEIVTAMAWAPEHGVPIREGGQEVARFPASAIPVRRRD